MTTTTARRAAITTLVAATAITLGMTASTWNPYTRAIDNATNQRMERIVQEDDRDWNCLTMGNGVCGKVYRPVRQGLADALAEGGSPNATTRDWEGTCLVRRWPTEVELVCADGWHEYWGR